MVSEKALVIMMAAVMLAVAAPVSVPESDADTPSGVLPDMDDYYYQLTYETSHQQITSVKKNGTTVYSATNTGSINAAYWNFSDVTGLGPFNTFYAAIEKGYPNSDTDKLCTSSDIGKIAYILKPSDLSYAILPDGTYLKSGSGWTMSQYDIMLIIPTVYWYSDGAGNMYLSNTCNNPNFSSTVNSHMRAYAHTLYDPVKGASAMYPYIGLGVYEATDAGTYGLMSRSTYDPSSNTGSAPTGSKTMVEYRASAAAATARVVDDAGTYMLWNLYERTLYNIMCETVMGSKNAKAVVGSGNQRQYGSGTDQNATWTGISNAVGWYGAVSSNSGTSSPFGGNLNYSKLFIENSWGSIWEFVDDTYVDTGGKLHAGNGLVPTLSPSSISIQGTDSTGNPDIPHNVSNVTMTSQYATSGAWDVPAAAAGVTRGGPDNPTGDSFWSRNNDCEVFVGGPWNDQDSVGLSTWYSRNHIPSQSDNIGARLAYAMTLDAVPGLGVHYDKGAAAGGEAPADSRTYIVGQDVTLLSKNTMQAPTGMTFIGWKQDGSDIVYPEGGVIEMPRGGLKLTAQWAEQYAIISFDAGEGSGTMTEQTIGISAKTALKPNTFTFPEHGFWKWSGKGNDGKNYEFKDAEAVSIPASSTPGVLKISLTAQWVSAYTLNYRVSAGSDPAPESQVIMAMTPVELADYGGKRMGFAFGGWSYGGAVYQPGDEFIMPEADVTMKARWISVGTDDEDDIFDVLSPVQPVNDDYSNDRFYWIAIAAAATAVATACAMVVTRKKRDGSAADTDIG